MRPLTLINKTLAFIGWGLFLTCLPAMSMDDVLVSKLSTDEGLSDNCVNAILCDSKGIVYFGTNDGLDYYDGHSVRHIAFPDDADASVFVFSLAQSPDGSLWIGTSQGLYIKGPHDDAVKIFTGDLDGKTIAWKSRVKYMEMTSTGKLYLIDQKQMLTRINCETKNISTLGFPVKILTGDKDKNIYALTDEKQLIKLTDGQEPEDLSESCSNELANISVSRLNYAFGRIFVSSIVGTPIALNVRDLSISRDFTSAAVKNLLQLSENSACVGSRHGIYLTDSTLTRTKSLLTVGENAVRTLCQDKDGGIWVGTQFNGALRIEKNEIQFKRYFLSEQKTCKVREFAEDRDGGIWIGTDTKGLLYLNPTSTQLDPDKALFPGKNILGLLSEGDYLWVGTLEDEIVTKINTVTGSITRYPTAGKRVYAFCRDNENRLWVGGLSGFKVGKDYPDGRFVCDWEVQSSQVCRIQKAPDGAVWVATISGRVWKYINGSFSTYQVDITNLLTDIFVESTGRVLLCSDGDGFFVYDSQNDCFVKNRSEAKRLMRVSESCGSNMLWATTPRYLFSVNPSDFSTILSFSVENLDVGRFNFSSNFINSTGTIFLGTSKGFISFSPEKLLARRPSPKIPEFSYLKILSPEVKACQGDISSSKPELLFKADAVSLELGVSSLDYSLLPTERLFWRIKEQSEKWAPVKNGVIQIGGLASGQWTLQIKNESFDGSVDSCNELKIKVVPAPLLTAQEVIILLLLAILIIAIVITVTINSTRRHIRKAQVKKDFEAKLSFLTSIAHEIRTPLSLILLPIDSLLQKFSSAKDNEAMDKLDIIKRNSMKLLILINELLDFQKLNSANFLVRSEVIDLRIPLKEAHRRFASTFSMEEKEFNLSVPDTPVYCEADVRILGRILDNMLSNALKYSSKYLNVKLQVKNENAVFEFENDGEVVPLDKRKYIFGAFSRYEEGNNAKVEGTGLGLSTSKAFAELLGGSLKMDKDQSTNRFILMLPIVEKEVELNPKDELQMFDKTLLVVEDDKDMAKVIVGYFKDSFNVIMSANGKDAYDKILQGANPSVIISDVMMPVMDGIELTKKLKTNLSTSHIPVILLSAQLSDKSLLAGLEQGADAYVEKPFSPEVLVKRVENLIENRKKLYEFFCLKPSGY